MAVSSTRQRILDEAASLFAARGIEATALREIAERLDVTKAALYYHFRSKEDLLIALVSPLHDEFGAVLSRVEDGEADATPVVVLSRLLDAALANAPAVRIVGDPGIRLVDRLRTRADGLEERAVIVLVGARASTEDRLRAIAALRVLDTVASRCGPRQQAVARTVGPAAAAAVLTAGA